MENSELIDEYIDQPAFKAQTDFAVNEVNRLLASFDKLKTAKVEIGLAKNLSDISVGVRKAEDETKKLIKAQDQLAINASKAYQEQLKNAKILQEANEKTAQSTQKLIDKLQAAKDKAAQLQSKNSGPEFSVKTGGENDIENLKKTGAVVSELDKAQAEAAISATEYSNSQKQTTNSVKESTIEVKKSILTQKQLALAKAEGALLSQKETAALKNQVREEIAVKGSLEQRRAALIRLNAVYDNQSPQERASAAGQRLQKIIGGLDTQVKTLENTTGRSQRNVGNYGSAFDKVKEGAGKAFGALRTLANIIPGLGIGGIFFAGFEAIKYFVSALDGAKQKLFDFTQQRKLASQINESASESAAKETASLLSLKSAIESTANPMATRLQAIKNLKKEFPGLFDGLTNEQLLTGKVAGAYDQATEAILKKARATAALTELEKIQAEKFEIIRKAGEKADALEEQRKNAKDIKTVRRGTSDAAGTIDVNTAASQRAGLEIRKKILEKQTENELSEINKREKFVLQFIEAGSKERIKIETEAGSKSTKAISDRLSQAFERFKLEQNNLLDLLKEGADDENSVYKVRLDYLIRFNEERKVLINEQLNYDLAKLEEKRSNDVKNLEAEKKKKGADIQGINREIATINFNAAEAAKTAKLKADIDLQNTDRENFKARKKLLEDFEQTKRDILDQELAYEKFTQDAIDKARKGQLEGMKKYNKTEEELLEERKKKMLSFLDIVQDYYSKFSAVVSGAFNIGTTKRKNEAQLAIDEIEKQKEADLKANDARVQSEQDKAANIAIINARAESQKRAQEQRQKEADRRQAQADKALAIFQITINIAKAVASHLGKPYLIALDLALGAAQLAIAAATPIPRFFKGKKRGDAYSGPAMVNDHPDGKTMEVIEHADGSLEFPQGRNVITNVKASDIIHPSVDDFINAALGAAHRDTNVRMGQKPRGENQLASALMQQTKILKEIARKPVATTHATDKGLVQVMHWGANQIKYVNENTNW